MDRFKISGGTPLAGTVQISGAKNAALPEMAAALLTAETVHLKNVPKVRDIITMAKLLAHMRAKVQSPDLPPSECIIAAETISHIEAPWGRWWRGSVTREYRCREGARSVPGRSICTSRRWRKWARKSRWTTATSRRESIGCAERKFTSTRSP
jgi:hypothetical protein